MHDLYIYKKYSNMLTSRSTTPETTHPGSERDDEIKDNIQINANIDPAYYGCVPFGESKNGF